MSALVRPLAYLPRLVLLVAIVITPLLSIQVFAHSEAGIIDHSVAPASGAGLILLFSLNRSA